LQGFERGKVMERITRDKLVKKVADNLQDKSINFSIPYHGKYKKKVFTADN